MKGLKWFDQNFELVILAILLFIMSVLSFSNVIMRYCFHHALSWSDEICCYCLALSAFFSLPCSIRKSSSIKVDTLMMYVPKSIQKIFTQICSIVMIVFLVWLFQGTLGIIGKAAQVHQASPALRIPVAYLYGIMGFAVALAIFRSVQMIVLSFRKKAEADTEVHKS